MPLVLPSTDRRLEPGAHPARRLVLSLTALGTVVAAGTAGYVLVAHLTWLDALYMTVTTVSTVGFREVGDLGTPGRLFTIGLIVVGVGTTFYTFAALAEFLIEGRLRELLGRRAMRRSIDALTDHVILCGFGRFGSQVARELDRAGVRLVIVEADPAAESALEASGHPFVVGSALEDATLAAAGIARARAIVIATGSDADNVFITLSAREAHPGIAIHARGESEAGIRRLRLAGAHQVISPYHLGGQRIANAIVRPAVVDFIELSAPGAGPEIDLEEVQIGEASPLAGATVGATSGGGTRLSVVAMKRHGEATRLSPAPDEPLRAGDRLVVVGDRESLRRLATLAEKTS